MAGRDAGRSPLAKRPIRPSIDRGRRPGPSWTVTAAVTTAVASTSRASARTTSRERSRRSIRTAREVGAVARPVGCWPRPTRSTAGDTQGPVWRGDSRGGSSCTTRDRGRGQPMPTARIERRRLHGATASSSSCSRSGSSSSRWWRVASNSLALFADAGHNLTDVVGIGIALFAIAFAARPASDARTFGFLRLEILAAVANAVLLFVIAGYVLFEAWRRFSEPAGGRVGADVRDRGHRARRQRASRSWLLRDAQASSLNMRGAYLEVMGDLLGSGAVIVAAVVIATHRLAAGRRRRLGRHRAADAAAHLEPAARGGRRPPRGHAQGRRPRRRSGATSSTSPGSRTSTTSTRGRSRPG